jgi:Protein of unknown function (DUF2997)
MKSIEIIISPKGDIKIEAMGFTGPDCEKATAFLEQALGKLTARQKKPEWYQRAKRLNQQRVGT